MKHEQSLYPRCPPEGRKPIPVWIVLTLVSLLLLVVISLNFLRPPNSEPRIGVNEKWPISRGHVLETRIVNRGVRESNHGAATYSRGEARVTYFANGEAYTSWLPATDDTTDRAWLSVVPADG